MLNRSLKTIAAAAAVMMFACAAQAELYERVSPSPWIVKDVSTPDSLAYFDVTADGQFVGLVGMSINLYDADRTFVRTLGTVPDYASGGAFGAFCRVTPDGGEAWVGYSVLGNVDDRIFSVPMSGDNATATHRATMPAPYDLEFAFVDGQWKPFVGGTNSTTFGSPNGVWLLDTSGADAHVKVADIGGYGAGIAFDADGNLYATSTQNRLYRFAAADVLDVISGGDALSTDNAEFVTELKFGGSDVTVDGAGSVFFNGNDTAYTGASLVGVLRPEYAGPYKYDNIAVGSGEFGNWSTVLAAAGDDVLSGDGTLYVADFYAAESLTAISIPEPATMTLLLLGSLLAVKCRRRS